MKKLKITLKRSNSIAIVELKENLSPKTIQMLWKLLPINGRAIHARWCGNEIWTTIPNLTKLEQENQTAFPSPGEVLITPAKPGVYNLGIWYGKGICFGPSGYIIGNVIGNLIGDFKDFASQCDKLLLDGADDITMEKYEND